MSFDSRRPRNIYIGPRPRMGVMDYPVLQFMDFVGYTVSGTDFYVDVYKNRFNGKTGRHPRIIVNQWVNQLNEPFDAIEELL